MASEGLYDIIRSAQELLNEFERALSAKHLVEEKRLYQLRFSKSFISKMIVQYFLDCSSGSWLSALFDPCPLSLLLHLPMHHTLALTKTTRQSGLGARSTET